LDDPPHVFVGQVAQHAANGLEHPGRFAADVVQFQLADDGVEVFADAFGRAADLFLFEFLLEQAVGVWRHGSGFQGGTGSDDPERKPEPKREAGPSCHIQKPVSSTSAIRKRFNACVPRGYN
jgi:hypothetical protein